MTILSGEPYPRRAASAGTSSPIAVATAGSGTSSEPKRVGRPSIWTAARKERLVELAARGFSRKRIARIVQSTPCAVDYQLRTMGVKLRGRQNCERNRMIVKARESGLSIRAVAKAYGLSETSVYDILKREALAC